MGIYSSELKKLKGKTIRDKLKNIVKLLDDLSKEKSTS